MNQRIKESFDLFSSGHERVGYLNVQTNKMKQSEELKIEKFETEKIR
jgi:hypothetical protein